VLSSIRTRWCASWRMGPPTRSETSSQRAERTSSETCAAAVEVFLLETDL
jgi:hypothetical protein